MRGHVNLFHKQASHQIPPGIFGVFILRVIKNKSGTHGEMISFTSRNTNQGLTRCLPMFQRKAELHLQQNIIESRSLWWSLPAVLRAGGQQFWHADGCKVTPAAAGGVQLRPEVFRFSLFWNEMSDL